MVTPRFTAEAQPPASDVQGAPGDSTDRTLTRTDRTVITLDGGNGDARSYSFSGADGEFAALGAEIEAMMAELQPELQGLMAELGPELESLMGELTPELQAEMAALGVEMSALGIDIAGMVSQDVISDMPQIMAEVRRSLEEAGIDPDSIEGWDDLQDIDVDMEEMRRAIAEAREELAQTLGPELKAEIRAALADARADLADARAEMADHHMEIANAMSEGHLGLEIARHALAAARDEIAAARANGELNFSGRDGAEDFGADLERTILDALRAAGVPVDGEGVPRPARTAATAGPTRHAELSQPQSRNKTAAPCKGAAVLLCPPVCGGDQ
jgi:hypothetical protein